MTLTLKSFLISTITTLIASASAHAVLISDWTKVGNGTASGLDTSSPTFGDGSSGSANGPAIYASIPETYTLANAGDTITLSTTATFSPDNTMHADQFRFGIFDSNGQTDRYGWLGYFATNTGEAVSTGPSYGRLWKRDANNTGSFTSGAGATDVKTANASPNNTSFAAGTYDLSISYQRDEAGQLLITWSIIATDLEYSLTGSYVDANPLTYSFDKVGISSGTAMNVNEIAFSDISVVIPEPSMAVPLFAGLAALAIAVRRYRSKRSS